MSHPISGRVRMLVRILPVRQFAVRKLPNPKVSEVTLVNLYIQNLVPLKVDTAEMN